MTETKPGKNKIVFHIDPVEVTPTHIAMFLSAAAHAVILAEKLIAAKEADSPTFPLHIAVEYGGKCMCGTIEPSDSTTEMMVSPVVH